MRNLDLNSITSLYENKVIARNLVSEAMPPYSAGEGGPEAIGSADYSAPKHRAAMSPQYGPETRYKQTTLSPEQMKKAGLIIGTEVLKFLAKQPEGKFVGGETASEEDKAFRGQVAQMIVDNLKRKSGEPIYQKSWAVHVARQLVDALLGSKALAYEKPAGSKTTRASSAPSAESEPDL